jgi:hypothetical protein
VNDDHFGYVTKSLKKILGTTCQACATKSKSYALRYVQLVTLGMGKKPCEHVIWVPMILLVQHALNSIIKLAHSPIKTY